MLLPIIKNIKFGTVKREKLILTLDKTERFHLKLSPKLFKISPKLLFNIFINLYSNEKKNQILPLEYAGIVMPHT